MMRIIILGLVFVIMSCGGTKKTSESRSTASSEATSQSSTKPSKTLSPEEQRVEDILMERLVDKLSLTEDQIEPFKNITNDFYADREDIKNSRKSQSEIVETVAVRKAEMVSALEKVLNPHQMRIFSDMGYNKF